MAKELEAGHWITVGEGEDAHHLFIANGGGSLQVVPHTKEGRHTLVVHSDEREHPEAKVGRTFYHQRAKKYLTVEHTHTRRTKDAEAAAGAQGKFAHVITARPATDEEARRQKETDRAERVRQLHADRVELARAGNEANQALAAGATPDEALAPFYRVYHQSIFQRFAVNDPFLETRLENAVKAVERYAKNYRYESGRKSDWHAILSNFRSLREHIEEQYPMAKKAAELTTKKRDKLDDGDFAFPKQRKEPLSDAEHVRQALARFDQVEDVSDADKAEAKRRILKAAKKYGIQVDAGDDVKAASQPSLGQVHVNAPLKKVSVAYTHDEDEDDAKKAGAAYTDDDCDGDKKMSAAEDESEDDQDGDGIPDDEDPADQDDQADDDDATPKGKQVDSTAGDDQDEGEQAKAAEHPMPEERPTRAFLTKMREHLSGKVSAEDLDAAIRHARAHAGGKGKAAKRMRAMAAGEDVSDLCAQGADYRLFLELRQASEAPDWIPFLPKPGTYTHPQWGKIAVTRDRSQQFIDNFHAKVYQEHIPLDAEHQTKLSGAFAYLRDLRMNEDGSVDAQVEWTDRGKALVEADRFKYFSPEWFDSWTAPDTGKEHHNVIIGGAFTTRPFFKDASLRPLVASERGLEVVDGDDVAARYTADAPAEAGRKDNGMPKPTEQPAQASEQRTGAEEQSRDDAASKRFAELEARFAASEQARQANEAALKQATEVIAGMQADARRKRFTEEVMGRGEQSGARWYGEPDKNVKLMERLADTLGEDSKEFRSFVEQQRAVGEALRQSSLFSELGSDASADADSPEAQLDTLAKKEQKQHAELSYEQAYRKAMSEHPEIQRRLVRR